LTGAPKEAAASTADEEKYVTVSVYSVISCCLCVCPRLKCSVSGSEDALINFHVCCRLLKRKERFTEAKDAPRVVDPEMAEKLAKRAKRFEALAV
jgi:hypothetical protein